MALAAFVQVRAAFCVVHVVLLSTACRGSRGRDPRKGPQAACSCGGLYDSPTEAGASTRVCPALFEAHAIAMP